MLREIQHEIGILRLRSAIGLSGHPGLSSVYPLPIDVPGDYRITGVTDEIMRKRRVSVMSVSHENAMASASDNRLKISPGAHGGFMLGEHDDLTAIKSYFDNSVEHDENIWDLIACGFTDQILEVKADSSRPASFFGMVAAQEYLFAQTHRINGLICGYTFFCECDSEGNQSEPNWPRWHEVESWGEKPAQDNGRGIVKCPHCAVSFKLSSPSLWNGFRHLKCLGRIKLNAAASGAPMSSANPPAQ